MATPAPIIQHVVVSNMHLHPILQQLRADGEALGWAPLTVLGDTTIRIESPNFFGPKLTLMRDWLRTQPTSAIILFTDAHDVRITARPEEVLAAYRSYAAPVVLSAERNCWPNERAAPFYMTYANPNVIYKYVNSGGYIGNAGDLLALLEAANAEEMFKPTTDDQGVFTRIYLTHQKNPAYVRLDTECRIFQCLYLAQNEIDPTVATNKLTGTQPLVWHGNAGGTNGDVFFRNIVCRWPVGGPVAPRRSAEWIAQYLTSIYQTPPSAPSQPVAWDLGNIIRRYYATNAILWYLYGLVLEKQCDLGAACEAHREALRLAPYFAAPVFSLAEYYVQTSRPTAACECLLTSVYQQPTVGHPNADEIPTRRLMDQLRAVSMLGPIYEGAANTTAARGVYEYAHNELSRAVKEAIYMRLSPADRKKCDDLWRLVCDSLARLTQYDADATVSPRYRAHGHAGLWT
jgi:tetratricopeptide (TPR) repeat protein